MKYTPLALVAFASLGSTTCYANEPVCHLEDHSCIESHTNTECHVYMAPSTIGVANMGIYTAKDLTKDEVLNFPDIAIPLLFRDWGDHGPNPDGTLWDRYIWDHGVANIEPKKSDLEREDTGAVFIPGVGCTINSRMEMHNIHSTHGSIYDTAGLHRSTDPGAGAFSPYHGSKTTASKPLEAGTELFAAYGDTWIPNIPGAIITLNDNMDLADEFLDDYAEWVDQHAKGLKDDAAKEGLWKLLKEFPITSDILGAMPQHSWKEVQDELEKKTVPSTTRYFVDQIGHHSVEWLQQHGKCQDHLKPGRSTISQAGRGAFASRDLPKGTVVGYSPLVHIGNAREILQVEYTKGGAEQYTVEDLIINYSFSHVDSTLLLTPYGAMVNYINHHRERANVKVVWPTKELVAHKPEWLQKDVDFLSNVHEKIGLSFDYIALRDLEEGEEIFMDYGDDWIEAWETHVANWQPGNANYMHSTEWKEDHLRTLEEVSSNPYPPNLQTLCIESYRSESGGGHVYVKPLRSTTERRYCDVLERHELPDGTFSYKAKIYLGSTGDSVIVDQVTGIELVDKLKSADWHLQNAFRHPIQLPDSVMPEAWKNKM